MVTIAAAISFILGASIGSFLSVVIYRLHKKKKGILFSRSFCPSCKKKIKWRHLIPVLNWLFLRGKCAYCGKRISPHYFFLETITGLLFLAAFLSWNFIEPVKSTIDPSIINYLIDWQIFQYFFFYIIIFGFLMVIFFYDLMYKEIPDKISIPAIAIVIAGVLILEILSPLNMLIGGAAILAFFLLQYLISRGTWIGGGDLRLGLLTGLLLGFEKGLLAVIIAYVLGALISIPLLIQRKVNRKSQIPFGPFLITGIITAIFLGEQIINWYFNSLTI